MSFRLYLLITSGFFLSGLLRILMPLVNPPRLEFISISILIMGERHTVRLERISGLRLRVTSQIRQLFVKITCSSGLLILHLKKSSTNVRVESFRTSPTIQLGSRVLIAMTKLEKILLRRFRLIFQNSLSMTRRSMTKCLVTPRIRMILQRLTKMPTMMTTTTLLLQLLQVQLFRVGNARSLERILRSSLPRKRTLRAPTPSTPAARSSQ